MQYDRSPSYTASYGPWAQGYVAGANEEVICIREPDPRVSLPTRLRKTSLMRLLYPVPFDQPYPLHLRHRAPRAGRVSTSAAGRRHARRPNPLQRRTRSLLWGTGCARQRRGLRVQPGGVDWREGVHPVRGASAARHLTGWRL